MDDFFYLAVGLLFLAACWLGTVLLRTPAHALEPDAQAPSMLDALLPVIVLIGLLATTIALFGVDATNGPLQVALLISAATQRCSRSPSPAPASNSAAARMPVRGVRTSWAKPATVSSNARVRADCGARRGRAVLPRRARAGARLAVFCFAIVPTSSHNGTN